MIIIIVLLMIFVFPSAFIWILSIPISMATMPFTVLFRKLFEKECEECFNLIFKFEFFNNHGPWKHFCNYTCCFCGYQKTTMERNPLTDQYERVLDTDHVKKCRSEFENNRGLLLKVLYMLSGGTMSVITTAIFVREVIKFIVAFSKTIVGCIFFVFIVWSMVVGHAEAAQTFNEKTVLGVVDPDDTSLAMYKSRYEKDDFFRKSVSVISSQADGDAFNFIVAGEMEARQDSAAGFSIQSKGVDEVLDVRVRRTWFELNVNKKYTTCQTKPIVHSYDECTQDSEKCTNDLKNIQVISDSDMKKMCHFSKDKTSSWSCDGPGCMSMRTGSTCGVCYNMKSGKCADVYQVTSQTAKAEVCKQVAGKAECIIIQGYSIFDSADSAFVLTEKPENNHIDTLLAIEEHIVHKGPINDYGQYSHKFGNIQWGSGDTSKYGTGDCDYVKVTHQCKFGKHRFYEMQSCMVDTYDYIRNLEIIKNAEFDPDSNVKVIKLNDVDFGLIKFRIPVDGLKPKELIDQFNVKSITINKCAGCYECQTHGILTVSINSEKSGPLLAKFNGVTSMAEKINVETGLSTHNIPISSDVKKVKVSMSIGLTSSNTFDCEFIAGPTAYHHTEVSMSTSQSDTVASCKGWKCFTNFKMGFSLKWWQPIITIMLIIGGVMMGSLLLVTFIKWMMARSKERNSEESKIKNIQNRKMKKFKRSDTEDGESGNGRGNISRSKARMFRKAAEDSRALISDDEENEQLMPKQNNSFGLPSSAELDYARRRK